MSNTERSSCESWYAPLKREQPEKKCRSRKKTAWRTAAVLILVLVLILGTSLAFSGSDSEKQYSQGEMPENWEDFFQDYFEDAQTTTVNTSIPRAALEPDFSLSLEAPGETELSLQQLYERCADSIVAITGTVEDESGYYWGTGIIASPDGLIVTNAHIIDGCDSAKVTLYNDESFEAKLVGVDGISDLALLKIEAEDLPAAVFGDISALAVGDEVAAIGNPLGEDFRSTLTNGIISAIDRGLNYNGRTMSLLQTNTAINQGNSGGALFNMYGQVVGITNMKMMSYYSSIEGIGFAIPSTTVKSVIDSLAANGEVRGRPSIGITVGAIPQDVSSHYDIPAGLYVSVVQENSDAQLKGVQVGDILTAVNGTPVSTTEEVSAIKDSLKVGDSMVLSLWREGEMLEVEIELMDTNDLY